MATAPDGVSRKASEPGSPAAAYNADSTASEPGSAATSDDVGCTTASEHGKPAASEHASLAASEHASPAASDGARSAASYNARLAHEQDSSLSSLGDRLLEVRDLRISFRTDEGIVVAVDGVDFEVEKGRTLGIVGESGSGKSVSTKALMKLLPNNAIIGDGSIMRFQKADGATVDIAGLDPGSREIRHMRGGEIAMIFQEPMASFSPVYTVGNQLLEAVRLHRRVGQNEAREIALDMLQRVGISNPALRLSQYPHELSGGMRQRAMIAVALATNPSLLIADEPTTALDVTIQAQILALMRDLQREFGMSIIFITHDMGVIAHVADQVAVMYLGKIVERGPTVEVIHDPKHPYTRGLLAALPDMDRLDRRLRPIGGDIPSPLERPQGCPFHARCPEAMPGRCNTIAPAATSMGVGRTVSCFLYE